MSDEEEYGEEGDQGEQPESSTIKELRAQLKEKDKELRQTRKESAEDRTFREQFEATQKEQAVKAKFQEAGLPEAAATLYLRDESAPEDVTEWASQYGFATSAGQSQTIAPPPGFTPSAGTPPGAQAMSRDEFDRLVKSDPQAAFAQATRQGVAWRHQESRDIAGGK